MTDLDINDALIEWNLLFPGECERYEGDGFYGQDTFYFGSIDAALRYSRNDFHGTPEKSRLYKMFIEAAVKEAIKVRGWEWAKTASIVPFQVYALGPKLWEGPFNRYHGSTLLEAFIRAIKNEE